MAEARTTFGVQSARTLKRWAVAELLPYKIVARRWYTFVSFLAMVDANPDASLAELHAQWRAQRGMPAVSPPADPAAVTP